MNYKKMKNKLKIKNLKICILMVVQIEIFMLYKNLSIKKLMEDLVNSGWKSIGVIKDPPIPGSFKKEDYERAVKEAMKSNDWYDENIEEPLKDIIQYLRKNGVNTECSCGHEMYIQCQYIPEGWIKMVHDLLYNYFHKNNKKINYEINVYHKVNGGHSFSTMEIKL